MPTNRPLKVFLCHSSNDKPTVRELYQKLRAESWIQPWLDEEELYPGDDWDLAIEKAVENSDIVLVCLSNGSINKRGYVQKELRFALDIALEIPEETIFIIPLRLEECSPPRSLRDWQYADYFEGQRDRAFQRLLSSFKKRADSLGINLPSYEVTSIKKKEVMLPKFYRRAIHLEYKINADAKTINDYLLQLYTGIAFFVEAFDSVYQVDTIEAFVPDGHNVFQWGFVASGTKETAQHGYTTIAGMKMTPDPIIESVPEMFLISISQGQRGVSVLSFDTDVKHAHMFTTGLVRDLQKAFSVKLLSPIQYKPVNKEDQGGIEKKSFSELSAKKTGANSLASENFEAEKGEEIVKKVEEASKERNKSKSNIISGERKKIFNFYFWWGRVLIGFLLGVSVSIVAILFSNSYFAPEELFGLIFVCALAGLFTYPHKFSLLSLFFGFFVGVAIGLTISNANFFSIIYAGLLLGLPVGALASRVLYWLKVIK